MKTKNKALWSIGVVVVLIACSAMVAWQPAIAPVAPPPAASFDSAQIALGQRLAALGDCAVCHTRDGGVRNAGGRPLNTPFGTIYSTNLTPDPKYGIGNWSYAAFERAMRHGIDREGHHLYPAFPYTSFTKTSDDDLKALYAYLMSQPPVSEAAPATKLPFPFNQRYLMAGWDLLFHRSGPYKADPSQSVEWNRGAYLAEGLGHCSACHTPRNFLGAERGGAAHFGGGLADGWDAPALNAKSPAPLPWTQSDFNSYLRHGFTPLHGIAGGPMAPVIQGVSGLPEDDLDALSLYLASFGQKTDNAGEQAKRAAELRAQTYGQMQPITGQGARIFASACMACHHDGNGPHLFGVRPSLAFNTNVHAARPDNLLRTILDGIGHPAKDNLGYMPGFRNSLNDEQISALAGYLREHFAQKPAWDDVRGRVAALRAATAPSH
ncbi:cytochrome c [Paraburkholderia hayleyella]|uniref:cytochrome c n=1 Tax=Paraburkholderia hayleyella TaxID=2152889 RepID=UPI001292033D|nr:cytochrome c [Paraburkholderia hayleyella]